MNVNTLRIIQSSDNNECNEAQDVFAIDEFFENIQSSSLNEPYKNIMRFDFEPTAGIPILDIIWQRFAKPFPNYSNHNQTGLAHLIILYREINNRIQQGEFHRLDCRGVDKYYLSLIKDIAVNEGVEFQSDIQPHSQPRLREMLKTLGRLLLVLIDHVLTLLASPLLPDVDLDSEVVFVPHLNRFETMKPVIDEAKYSYQVVLPVTNIEWIRAKWTDKWEPVQPYDPVPVSRFITPRLLFSEIVLLFRLAAELVQSNLKNQLTAQIESAYGFQLNRSISHSLSHVYRLFSGIPNLLLAKQLFGDMDPSSVVIGSQSLRSQAFVFAADQQDVASFHISHSVTCRREAVPKASITHIVASKIDEEYVRDSHMPEAADVKGVGRPLLSEIAEDRTQILMREEKLKIVAATQPFKDRTRREFVRTVLECAATFEPDVEVVVKTHPNETTALYDDVITDVDIKVTVTSEDLRHHLTTADLTCVINTSVCMKSMILGTPTVSINFWSPRIPVRPYMESECIPILQTPESAAAFFKNLDATALQQIRDEQTAFFDENYLSSQNISADLAEYVYVSGD